MLDLGVQESHPCRERREAPTGVSPSWGLEFRWSGSSRVPLTALRRRVRRPSLDLAFGLEAVMAKNTGRGYRKGAVRGRSEFRHNGQYFKRDTTTGRILNGSKNPHKGVVDEK